MKEAKLKRAGWINWNTAFAISLILLPYEEEIRVFIDLNLKEKVL